MQNLSISDTFNPLLHNHLTPPTSPKLPTTQPIKL